jgi:uncharacterized DUF497 family protein
MPLTFEWDPRKEGLNLAKHGVGFEQASTIFGDRSSLTIPDPSIRRQKSVTSPSAERSQVNCSLLSTPNKAIIFVSLAQGAPVDENVSFMKKSSNKSEQRQMRPEYDFSQGERGKYARRYAQGTNVVVLEPDVAKVFRSSKAVNASLRKIIHQRALEVAK